MRQASLRYSIISVICLLMIGFAPPCLSQMGSGFGNDGEPIDIQANEQEFADDHMIARGNVRVTHKDTIIDAPMATLYKDAAGKPQRAVFTGHPRLKQGLNKIDADKLIFEINTQTIFAEGNAHSEVVPDDASKVGPQNAKAQGAKTPADASAKEKDAAKNEKAQGEQETGDARADRKAAPAANQAREKIVTDSDRQVFNRTTGKFEAKGHVKVKHGDILVHSDSLQLVYGSDDKPETAVFTGNVKATQNQNHTEADTMTYFLNTKRLQATGHVRSKVVQEKKAEASKKGGLLGGSKEEKSASTGGSARLQVASGSSSGMETIFIYSDAQDYSENNGRVTADGNVKIFYEDTIGVAPKVILLRNPEDGRAEKVLMSGRCQITQPGKRWIADKITYTVDDNKVLAEGNTKAIILQSPDKTGAPAPMLAQTKKQGIAEKPSASKRRGAIGSRTIEIMQ